MEELNLNKKNGEILSSGEWNRIISALNALINYYNNFPDKISAFDNDSGYLTNFNIEGLASKQYVRDAIQALVDSGVMAGPKGEDGITPHINQTNKHWVIGNTDTGIIAEGTDGISPTVTVLEIEGGHSVTISDASGSYTFNVLNGIEGLPGVDGTTPHIDPTTKHWIIGETDTNILAEGTNGQNGSNGTNGSDGVTPTVIITSISNGHNVEFSYGSGDSRNTNFNVMDGNVANQLQADWNQTNSNQADYIKNKPIIPTVPGNESASSGGNTLSVVTTGDKYNWNNKASIWSGTQALYTALSPNYDSNTIYIITES